MIRKLSPIIASFVLLVGGSANASCDFLTGEYLKELSEPSSILSITIETPKSAKYNKNLFKILTSNSLNIPPDLKKKYTANISVNYKFGRCEYKAKIRQNGDWKDHIQMESGQPYRSLVVKLKEGNILNSVRFKLLIPKTRNDLNEILGSVILRKMGFIAPETFQVNTSINGFRVVMLFQEDATKELLERNNRREGAIFEGDENLLWSMKGYENFQLEKFALSRLTNPKWTLKGPSSTAITLDAAAKLQNAYLDYANNIERNSSQLIFPNNKKTRTFEDYLLILLAMNGSHALRPHNRKYYYNVFQQSFEPIYYDGNLVLDRNSILSNEELISLLSVGISGKFKHEKNISKTFLQDQNNIFNDFFKRVLLNESEASKFYNQSLNKITENHSRILKILKSLENGNATNKINSSNGVDGNINFEQILITDITKQGNDYLVSTSNGTELALSIDEVIYLLSDNILKGKRAVFTPTLPLQDAKYKVKSLNFLNGHVTHSGGINILINEQEKKIAFRQENSSDWVLLTEVYAKDWRFEFVGVKNASKKNFADQRFNDYGMTGCLTFYRSKFHNASIRVDDANCEDGLNIVDSLGEIDQIVINNSFADALDMDFSQIHINYFSATNAGNDCFDVSSGTYSVKNGTMLNCADKAMSVGEKSIFTIENANVENAFLGIASKDSSIAVIEVGSFQNIRYCYDISQKKQEYAGAALKVQHLICDAEHTKDVNSKFFGL